jgi:hypothetical protein
MMQLPQNQPHAAYKPEFLIVTLTRKTGPSPCRLACSFTHDPGTELAAYERHVATKAFSTKGIGLAWTETIRQRLDEGAGGCQAQPAQSLLKRLMHGLRVDLLTLALRDAGISIVKA